MGKRKFNPGDWATIKYGEFAGRYAKVTMHEKDGGYVVIPYDEKNEPGSMLTLNARSLDLLPPYEITLEQLQDIARADLLYEDIKDKIFPPFNLKILADYKMTAKDIRDAILKINDRCGVDSSEMKRRSNDIYRERINLQMGEFSPEYSYRQRRENQTGSIIANLLKPRNPLALFREWFWMVMNIFYKNLCIDERYNEEFFSDAPETEDEMFNVAYSLAEKLYWRLEERFSQKEDMDKLLINFEKPLDWEGAGKHKKIEELGYIFVCSDIVSRVDAFLQNKGQPKSEWVYSSSAKRHIVMSYESGENNLKDATDEARDKYREFVQELYMEGDIQALKILAWSHYEGNEVYPQDWKLSEKFLLELFERTGDPYAANSLGYIYYYGRTDYTFRPDYEKAFYYFSYGALAAIDESIYKTADMLIAGRGTRKNIDMGLDMIVDGYKASMQDFCEGNYGNKLADYAIRMGNACRDGLVYGMNLRDAYKFYLEARFALEKRMENGGDYGDDSVAMKINHEINMIAERMNLNMNQNTVKTDFPLYLSQLFEDKFPLKVSINAPGPNSRSKKGTLKIERFRPAAEMFGSGIFGEDEELSHFMEVPKILVAYPELSYAELVTEITYGLENISVAQKQEKGAFFLADGFRKNEKTNALEFYANGQLVAAIDAEWYTIKVNKGSGKTKKGTNNNEQN